MSNYKILAITMTAALAATLTACGKDGSDNGISPIIQTASAETVTENTSALPETASSSAETTLAESNELDEKTAEMLRREFAKYIGEIDPSYVRIYTYYGKYNGCEVFLPLYKLGYDAAEDWLYIAGYEIYFPCLGYEIYVHRDGEFYELAEAYEMGYIGEEDVAKIAEIQNGTPPETTLAESNELDEETAEMLRREFAEYINETDPLYTPFDPSRAVIKEYYGRYSGCEVFPAIYRGGEEALDCYYAAGYEMIFPCLGYSIYVHKDGNIWELDAAYEEGIVSEEDVAKIAEKHNGVPTEKAAPSSNAESDMEWREVERSRKKELAELRRKFVEFIREAKPEYAELEPSEVGFEAYYGTYNGWEAFLPLYKMNKTGYPTMSEYITIAGYEMYFPCLGYEIYVHRDGEFYELAEAYEKGFIGEDAVSAIAEDNHARYFFAFP